MEILWKAYLQESLEITELSDMEELFSQNSEDEEAEVVLKNSLTY